MIDGISTDNQPGLILQPGAHGQWDSERVSSPQVLQETDSTWWMYYMGNIEWGYDELSSRHQIGLALSEGSDFRKWRRWGEI